MGHYASEMMTKSEERQKYLGALSRTSVWELRDQLAKRAIADIIVKMDVLTHMAFLRLMGLQVDVNVQRGSTMDDMKLVLDAVEVHVPSYELWKEEMAKEPK